MKGGRDGNLNPLPSCPIFHLASDRSKEETRTLLILTIEPVQKNQSKHDIELREEEGGVHLKGYAHKAIPPAEALLGGLGGLGNLLGLIRIQGTVLHCQWQFGCQRLSNLSVLSSIAMWGWEGGIRYNYRFFGSIFNSIESHTIPSLVPRQQLQRSDQCRTSDLQRHTASRWNSTVGLTAY
ncbi:hypothetical protein NE237_014735 [Protea cynaroides]|uniref:Uncharacterized protein n=1 Tax=Protea cynaroides TaxID=273540 RepID=A0A9Q0KCT3_9MAGN|nr:hypothetical protein NE237_014735 [Protea cynaroides]